jgi:manganese efflux pump family protein
MSMFTLLAIAFALAMDAFAVALVTGLTLSALTGRHVFRLSFHFGLFQAFMPIIGWVAGYLVRDSIEAFDHWIAFGLLAYVGIRMIYEATGGCDDDAEQGDPTRGWSLVILSTATSIDALAVGLSLAVIGVPVAMPAIVIGVVAAGMTTLGLFLGRRIGSIWGKRVEVLGGLILFGIGVKIVIEHTM